MSKLFSVLIAGVCLGIAMAHIGYAIAFSHPTGLIVAFVGIIGAAGIIAFTTEPDDWKWR